MEKHAFDPAGCLGERLQTLSRAELTALAETICRILTERGTYHGGIRPDNISRAEDGTVGLGAPARTDTKDWTTEELEFMAPEVFWSGSLDASADVYSLGLLLYAGVMGGRLPFYPDDRAPQPEDMAAALRRRMNGEALPLARKAGRGLMEIIARATQCKPADRYATPAELCAALEQYDAEQRRNVPTAQEMFNKPEQELSEVERMMLSILAEEAAAPVPEAEPEIAAEPEAEAEPELKFELKTEAEEAPVIEPEAGSEPEPTAEPEQAPADEPEAKPEKAEIILWVLAGVLLLVQLVLAVLMVYGDGDDAYYVAISAAAEESGRMYQKIPYTGMHTELDVRHGLAPFPIWIAWLAQMTGITTVIVAKTLVPVALISMTYGVFYLLGSRVLFAGEGAYRKKWALPAFLLCTEVLVLFGDYSYYTVENFMIARSRQGKAALGSILIPMIFFLLLTLLRKIQEEQKITVGFWVLLGSVMTACCLASTMGALLACMLVGTAGLCGAVSYRKWKLILPLIGCCIPCIVYAGMYLLLG